MDNHKFTEVDRRDGDVMLTQEGCPSEREGYCACDRPLPTVDLSLNHSLLLPQLGLPLSELVTRRWRRVWSQTAVPPSKLPTVCSPAPSGPS